MRAIFLSHVLLVLFAACGGGSGGGGGSTAFALHFDTAAGQPNLVSTRVLGVSFEGPTGTLTGSALAAETEITLLDPAGESRGLVLSAAPPSGTVALRLLVVDPAVAIAADGSQVAVSLGGTDLRIPLAAAWAGGDAGLLVAHQGVPIFGTTATGWSWSPGFRAAAASTLGLRVSDAVVVAVDAARATILARLPGHGDLTVDIAIQSDALLTGASGAPTTRAAFLAELSTGSVLACDASRSSSRSFEGRSLHHRGRSRGELHLLGRIASIDSPTQSFSLEVQSQRNDRTWVASSLGTITVDASGAVFYESHRSVQTALTFGDLTVGALVEVEGGPVQNGTMIAREVELEDDSSTSQQGESEGRVQSVDLVLRTITVVPRGDDPLLVGGVAVTSATIEVGNDVPIDRKTDSGTVGTTLDTLTSSDRIWVRGSVTGPTTIVARWIRVEAR